MEPFGVQDNLASKVWRVNAGIALEQILRPLPQRRVTVSVHSVRDYTTHLPRLLFDVQVRVVQRAGVLRSVTGTLFSRQSLLPPGLGSSLRGGKEVKISRKPTRQLSFPPAPNRLKILNFQAPPLGTITFKPLADD